MATKIYINGKREEVKEYMNITELLEFKKIRPEIVTVELNDAIITKDKYKQTLLKLNDRLDFVYYMGGGEVNTRLADNVLELIGNTPMVKLNRIVEPDMADIVSNLRRNSLQFNLIPYHFQRKRLVRAFPEDEQRNCSAFRPLYCQGSIGQIHPLRWFSIYLQDLISRLEPGFFCR